MPLDFPNTPSFGQTYSASGITWTWDGTKWTSVSNMSVADIEDTPPSRPFPGQLWFDSVNAQLYVWYSDPNSSQWVIATANAGGLSADAPVDGNVYGRSNSAWSAIRQASLGVNVLDYGGDATGVADNLVAFNAAAAHVPSGQDVIILVPRGIYNMSGAFTGNGRNVTLQVAPGTVWTGFNPPYYGPRIETVAKYQRQESIVLSSTVPVTPSLSSSYVQENGAVGPTAWAATWIYAGTPTAGQPFQSVPQTRVARWDNLAAASNGALALEHRLAIFPLSGGSNSGSIAEWNPMNRTGDPGWGNVFAAVNCYGGLHVVPESDTITGGIHFGFHTQFAFAAVQSSNVNNIGYKPQTYNAFIAYPNAIAPGGDVVYAGGDTTGTTANFPYSPLRIDKNFLHGIITDPTFHANDGAIIHTQPGNGVVWDDGTGTASITGTEVSAGVVNVTIANAGTARLIVSNAAVTSSVGFACGATYATFLSDFTKHISLYDDHGGNKAGLSVTSSDFSNNYVALGTGYHNFYIGGTLAAQIGPSAVTGSVGLQIGGWTGPTWTTGSGVPAATAPVGSLYSRVGGAVGATLYVSRGGGTWAAVAGV